MKEITADKNLVAKCGLYCGACSRYLAEKCPGCAENVKATWCKIRQCCLDNKFLSCADCKDFSDVNDCKKFNNFLSKIFAFFFKSNRKACIEKISAIGCEKYAKEMAEQKIMSIKR
ncbi:DUF3795 domain-containing protein [Candidatus Margulisiibacteriota bacterium]